MPKNFVDMLQPTLQRYPIFLVILNALAKNIIPLIRQNSFLGKKRKGDGPVTSPTEGGSGGAPAFTRTTLTSKSPSEAVFILRCHRGREAGSAIFHIGPMMFLQ